MKNKTSVCSLLTGGAAGGMGLFGLSICCLPVAAGFTGLLGIVAVFSYQYAKWLVIAGVVLLIMSGFLFWKTRSRIRLSSTLTCPECGFQKEEAMPKDACIYFYECSQCHAQLKPKEGDCCVFCSYGSVPCPPKQANCECSHDQ